jgi:hypothetical protein
MRVEAAALVHTGVWNAGKAALGGRKSCRSETICARSFLQSSSGSAKSLAAGTGALELRQMSRRHVQNRSKLLSSEVVPRARLFPALVAHT